MPILSRDKTKTSKLIRRITCDSMLLVAALILSYIESFLPLFLAVPVPGIKLGLANLAVMIAAYDAGSVGSNILDALSVSLFRIFIMAILFGSISSFWFSFSGGMVSFFMLAICTFPLKRFISPLGTSLACAAGHNAGQIFAAVLFFGNPALIYFLPGLLFISLITGALTGIALVIIIRRLGGINIYSPSDQPER